MPHNHICINLNAIIYMLCTAGYIKCQIDNLLSQKNTQMNEYPASLGTSKSDLTILPDEIIPVPKVTIKPERPITVMEIQLIPNNVRIIQLILKKSSGENYDKSFDVQGDVSKSFSSSHSTITSPCKEINGYNLFK